VKIEWKPVKALFTLQRRTVMPEADAEYREVGVRSFGKGLFIKEPITGFDLGNKRVFRVEEGDLIVSNVFAWEGAVGLAAAEHDGLIGSHRFMTWTRTDSTLNTRYVLEYFRSEQGVEELAKASPGSAGRNRTLSIKNFEDILIPIPSRPDQDRIAAHLDSFVEPARLSVDAAEKTDQLLRNLRERVLNDLAEQRVVLLRTVLRPTGDLVDVEPDHVYRLLGVRSFGRGAFASGSMSGADTAYKKLRQFRAGQVCYPKLMAWQGAFSTVPKSLDGCFASPEFVGFDVDATRTSPSYIDQCLRWDGLVAAAAAASTGTNANRRRLRPHDFLSLSVPLPDQDTQASVASMLGDAAKASDRARAASGHAAALLPAARNEVFSALV
jgi:hypothetical protein